MPVSDSVRLIAYSRCPLLIVSQLHSALNSPSRVLTLYPTTEALHALQCQHAVHAACLKSQSCYNAMAACSCTTHSRSLLLACHLSRLSMLKLMSTAACIQVLNVPLCLSATAQSTQGTCSLTDFAHCNACTAISLTAPWLHRQAQVPGARHKILPHCRLLESLSGGSSWDAARTCCMIRTCAGADVASLQCGFIINGGGQRNDGRIPCCSSVEGIRAQVIALYSALYWAAKKLSNPVSFLMPPWSCSQPEWRHRQKAPEALGNICGKARSVCMWAVWQSNFCMHAGRHSPGGTTC